MIRAHGASSSLVSHVLSVQGILLFEIFLGQLGSWIAVTLRMLCLVCFSLSMCCYALLLHRVKYLFLRCIYCERMPLIIM
jgi:hypothetical protein